MNDRYYTLFSSIHMVFYLLNSQLFLDGLANSGTPATSLVIRDILKSTDDVRVIVRLMSSFPIAIRHPSELLGNELDVRFYGLFNQYDFYKLGPVILYKRKSIQIYNVFADNF